MPLEEAEACQRVLEHDGLPQKALADALGKSESTISEILRLNTLPDVINDATRADDTYLSRRCLLRLSKIDDAEKQLAEFEQFPTKHSRKKLRNCIKDTKIRGTRTLIGKLLDKMVPRWLIPPP